MATPNAAIATAAGQDLAAMDFGDGVLGQVQVIADSAGTILGGSDAPLFVEADATIDSAQQSATIGVLGEIRDNVADALAALGGGDTAIASGGHTALPEYGAYTDAQELADVVDLFAADVIARLEALEA
jgi:hypothetical protein